METFKDEQPYCTGNNPSGNTTTNVCAYLDTRSATGDKSTSQHYFFHDRSMEIKGSWKDVEESPRTNTILRQLINSGNNVLRTNTDDNEGFTHEKERMFSGHTENRHNGWRENSEGEGDEGDSRCGTIAKKVLNLGKDGDNEVRDVTLIKSGGRVWSPI